MMHEDDEIPMSDLGPEDLEELGELDGLDDEENEGPLIGEDEEDDGKKEDPFDRFSHQDEEEF